MKYFSLVYLLLATQFALSVPVPMPGVELEYQNDNGGPKQKAHFPETATQVNEMVPQMANTIEKANNGNKKAAQRMRSAFGNNWKNNYGEIKSTIDGMQNAKIKVEDTSPKSFDQRKNSNPNSAARAAYNTGTGTTGFSKYWHRMSNINRAGTMLHELSHQVSRTGDGVASVGSLRNVVNMAQQSAIKNDPKQSGTTINPSGAYVGQSTQEIRDGGVKGLRKNGNWMDLKKNSPNLHKAADSWKVLGALSSYKDTHKERIDRKEDRAAQWKAGKVPDKVENTRKARKEKNRAEKKAAARPIGKDAAATSKIKAEVKDDGRDVGSLAKIRAAGRAAGAAARMRAKPKAAVEAAGGDASNVAKMRAASKAAAAKAAKAAATESCSIAKRALVDGDPVLYHLAKRACSVSQGKPAGNKGVSKNGQQVKNASSKSNPASKSKAGVQGKLASKTKATKGNAGSRAQTVGKATGKTLLKSKIASKGKVATKGKNVSKKVTAKGKSTVSKPKNTQAKASPKGKTNSKSTPKAKPVSRAKAPAAKGKTGGSKPKTTAAKGKPAAPRNNKAASRGPAKSNKPAPAKKAAQPKKNVAPKQTAQRKATPKAAPKKAPAPKTAPKAAPKKAAAPAKAGKKPR